MAKAGLARQDPVAPVGGSRQAAAGRPALPSTSRTPSHRLQDLRIPSGFLLSRYPGFMRVKIVFFSFPPCIVTEPNGVRAGTV